jgi:hypothetical protein
MKAVLTEHRNLLIASLSAILAAGGSGYFLYQSLAANNSALEELQSISLSLSKIQSVTPSPTKENLDDLNHQKAEATKCLDDLKDRLKALDLPTESLKPPEFQKVLNEKSQSIAKLAEVNGVILPQNFYFNFNNYTKTVPKEEATPKLGRQLHVAELLCRLLIQTSPSEVKFFERSELELEKDPASQKEEAPQKEKEKGRDKPKDSQKEKAKAQESSKPIFESSFFRLQFVTRPGPLREFLNALASEKSCLLVTRNLKIENQNQKGPPKRSPEEIAAAAALASNPGLNPLAQPAPPNPLDALAPASATGTPGSASELSQFIVGDEKIEVSMRVEFVSFLEEAAAK